MKKGLNTLHMIYMIVSPILIVVLVALVIYYANKAKKNVKESLCLCNGAQIYQTRRNMTGLVDPIYGETNGGSGCSIRNLGMPYDIETNGGYTPSCCD